MNAKLIAIATVAFVAGHDIAVTMANRRVNKMQADLDQVEKASLALHWFTLGHKIALEDKDAVRVAFSKHFPPTPPSA